MRNNEDVTRQILQTKPLDESKLINEHKRIFKEIKQAMLHLNETTEVIDDTRIIIGANSTIFV